MQARKFQKAKDLRAMVKRATAVYARVYWGWDLDHYLLISKSQALQMIKGVKPNDDIEMKNSGWSICDIKGVPILYIAG